MGLKHNFLCKMASGSKQTGLGRAELLYYLYKYIVKANLDWTLDVSIPIDYQKVTEVINSVLIESHHIDAGKLILVNT